MSAMAFFFYSVCTALAIIAEHSFYLWDRAPSKEIDPLISAINTYQSYGKHTAVTQAIDDLFKEGGGHLFEEAKNRNHSEKKNSTFAERLAKIAQDNRLRKSYLLRRA